MGHPPAYRMGETKVLPTRANANWPATPVAGRGELDLRLLDQAAALRFSDRVRAVSDAHDVEDVPELTLDGGRAQEKLV